MARIASMVARLTPPMIVQGDIIPNFGRICRSKLNSDENSELKNERIQSYLDLNVNEKGLSSPSSSSLDQICSSAIKNRVIFFGEQHHQPKVLSIQLQVIHHIWQAIKMKRHIDGNDQAKLHIVFEQWSLEDQPYLDSINQSEGEKVGETLRTSDQQITSEGFSLDHYSLLIKFAREIDAKVWGGFPPRSWAKIIAKGVEEQEKDDKQSKLAFEKVQKLDQNRYEESLEKVEDFDRVIPPLPIEQYDQIDQVSWAHRTYLKSMFSPNQRPLIPIEVNEGKERPLERIGFTPAQALKDTFFAHTISTILESDPNNVVLAICGLGHCEWLFGAPERLRGEVKPFIILSKPNDSGYWSEHSQDSIESDKHDEWQRKQADAILLYDWID